MLVGSGNIQDTPKLERTIYSGSGKYIKYIGILANWDAFTVTDLERDQHPLAVLVAAVSHSFL